MLISMPTGTSTIFGVFQVIWGLPGIMARCLCQSEVRATSDVTQVRALLPIPNFDLRTISTIAGAPFRRWYLTPWHPRFHPYPDLPH